MSAVLIAGLGNPGTKYANTRHNVGWMLIDLLASRLAVKLEESPFDGLMGVATRNDRDVIMLKPTTYMNLSGDSLLPCAQHFGVEASAVVVAVDEVQLPAGRIKLSSAGSDSGHNGTASVIERLQTPEFRRLRIGVGTPPKGEMKDFVLSVFTNDEESLNRQALELASDAVLDWVDHGADDAEWGNTQSRFNARNLQPAFRIEKTPSSLTDNKKPLTDEKEHS